jgi:hypothetical protein
MDIYTIQHLNGGMVKDFYWTILINRQLIGGIARSKEFLILLEPFMHSKYEKSKRKLSAYFFSSFFKG